MQANVELIDSSAAAAAMLHPVRGRLLEQFREPRSAAEAARNLGLPRQRIGHHVRVLRDAGLLEKAGERRAGNFVEKLLQATARVYVIAPQALGALGTDPAALRDRFSSEYLAASAARTIRDLAALRQRAQQERKKIATLTLETEVRFAGARQQAAFAEELGEALAALTAKYHDADAPKGRRFRFTVGGYPAATLTEEPRDDAPPDSSAVQPLDGDVAGTICQPPSDLEHDDE